jgi:hypothetical protein
MEQIHVFVNRKKVEFEQPQVTGGELLTRAGFAGNEWDLLQLQGEGDPTGGTLLLATQSIPLKNGLHFRVIPGNRTFGTH